MRSKVPVLDWLAGYRKDWLRPDIIAGLVTAAVVIPKAMAYASIAKLPLEDESAATEKLVAVDASYNDMLTALKPLMDFIAIKPSEGNPKDAHGVVTGLTLEGDVYAQMSLQDAMSAQQVPSGATVVFNDILTNASNVEMGLIEYEDPNNHTVVCIFKTANGAIIVSLASPTPKFADMSQELINIVGSIGLLE